MNGRGAFLIVEDEPSMARDLAGQLAGFGPSFLAHSLAEALPFLERVAELRGILLDIGLPDGPGLELLRALRERGHDVHVTILTNYLDPVCINLAYQLGAHYHAKPMDAAGIEASVARCAVVAEQPSERSLDAAMATLIGEWGLSPRQEQIFRMAVDEIDDRTMALQLGVSVHVIKKHVRELLQRAGCESRRELRRVVRSSVRPPDTSRPPKDDR